MTVDGAEIAEAVDLVVQSARELDFELLHSHHEAVATLIVRARYLCELTGDADAFESSIAVTRELRRRRKLE